MAKRRYRTPYPQAVTRWLQLRALPQGSAFGLALLAAAAVGARLGGPLELGLGLSPETAVVLFTLMHAPRAAWPPLVVVATGIIALAQAAYGHPLPILVAGVMSPVATALLGADLLRRARVGRHVLDSLQGLFAFTAVVLVSSTLGETAALLFETLLSGRPPPPFALWPLAWLGSVLGVTTVLPFMLAWRELPKLRHRSWARLGEVALLTSLGGLFAALVVTAQLGAHPEGLLLLVPIFLWTSTRFGLAWGTLTNLVFVFLIRDVSLISADDPTWATFQRAFVLISVLSSLFLGVLLADRDRMITSLGHREAQLRAVLGSIPDAFFRVRPDGRVIEPLGHHRARSPTLGFPLVESFAPEEAQLPLRRNLQASLLDGRPRSFTVEHGADTPRWLEGRTIPLDGGYEELLVSLRDITHERLGAQRAFEAEKMKAIRHLTAGVAHDFNNLLTTVIGNLDLVRDEMTDPEHRASLDDVSTAARRGRELVHRLQAYSEGQILHTKTVDLAAELPALVRRLRDRTGARLRLISRIPAARWQVSVDLARLESALGGLVENAHEASGYCHEVLFRAEVVRSPDGGSRRIRLTVEDDGEGMSPEALRRAREPFFSTRGPNRTGLGLSMAHGFANQSGGELILSSEPRRGTRAVLELPLHSARSRTRDLLGRPPAELVVLIMDADPEVRRVVSQQVVQLGYAPVEAESRARATRLLADTGPVALVVSELSGADADFVAEAPRQPFLLLQETGARPAPGPVPVLAKPLEPRALRNKLAELLPQRPVTPLPNLTGSELTGSELTGSELTDSDSERTTADLSAADPTGSPPQAERSSTPEANFLDSKISRPFISKNPRL